MISPPGTPVTQPLVSSPVKKRGYSQFESHSGSFYVPEEQKNVFRNNVSEIPQDLIDRLIVIYNTFEVSESDPIEKLWIAGKAVFNRCHLHFILWRALFLSARTDSSAHELYLRFPFKEALYDLAIRTDDTSVFIKCLKVLLHYREDDFRNKHISALEVIKKSKDIDSSYLLNFFSARPSFTIFSPDFQTLVFEQAFPKSDQLLADLTHEIDEIGHPSLYAWIDEEWCMRLSDKAMPLKTFASLPSHILPKLTLYVVTHNRDLITPKMTDIKCLTIDCRTEDREKMYTHLVGVHILHCSQEHIKAYRSISAMTSLTSLEMQPIPGNDLSPFSRLTHLRQIALRGSLMVEDAEIAQLALPRLAKIELSRFYKVSSKGISHLRLEYLTELSIISCPLLTDQFNDLFCRLTHLQQLNLSSCPITDEGVKDLPKSKDLEKISLEDTKITNSTTPLFALLVKLTYLNIANVKGITDAALEYIKKCQKLKVLKISSELAEKAEQNLHDLPYFSEVVKSARRRLQFED